MNYIISCLPGLTLGIYTSPLYYYNGVHAPIKSYHGDNDGKDMET
jgi:hypothetical protein